MTMYPYRPLLGITERLSWLTSVHLSQDHTEQRVKHRLIPRQYYTYTHSIVDTQIPRFDGFVWKHQTTAMTLPLWTDATQLGTATTAGSTFVTVATANALYSTDASLVMWGDSTTHEEIAIQSVASSGVHTTGLTNAWTTAAWVMPAHTATINQPANISNTMHNQATAEVSFRVTDNVNVTAGVAATTYQSLDLFEDRPTIAQPLSRTIDWDRAEVDGKTGPVVVDTRSDFPDKVRSLQYVKGTRADIWTMRQWLYRRTGRIRPFWMPTFQNDALLASAASSGDSTVTITDINYRNYYTEHTEHKDITFIDTSDNLINRRITGSSAGAGNTEVLTLDSALGVAASTSYFKQICFLQRSRLDADAIEFAWDTNTRANIAFNTRLVVG